MVFDHEVVVAPDTKAAACEGDGHVGSTAELSPITCNDSLSSQNKESNKFVTVFANLAILEKSSSRYNVSSFTYVHEVNIS